MLFITIFILEEFLGIFLMKKKHFIRVSAFPSILLNVFFFCLIQILLIKILIKMYLILLNKNYIKQFVNRVWDLYLHSIFTICWVFKSI